MKKILLAFVPLSILSLQHPVAVDQDTMKLPEQIPVSRKPIPELQNDGPYVQYRDDKVVVKYILQSDATKTVKADSISSFDKQKLSLQVGTDIPGKFFTVQLKKKMEEEKSEYQDVKKQFVLSDIEGNFTAFRKLLQGNGVIDDQFNWTFGDGHLVLVGDFFDRGSQVTEVLWLIYSLEEKAKAAGGYVHFILGNHEIMNLSGDIRYVQQKYMENAALLQQMYESLYDENTELGRWLRTKNIVEKVGDILYTHGGISTEMNNLGITVGGINRTARPYYATYDDEIEKKKLNTIYSSYIGPFWYRGYYMGKPRGSLAQVDSSLVKFLVKHIVTGHTVVADTISVWYNGRVLNTDVHHAGGKSEALLIEGEKFYRVNPVGDRVFLMEGMLPSLPVR